MPFEIINGTSAAFNFQTGTNLAAGSSTGATPNSWNCVADYMSADIEQDLLSQVTFCTGGWDADIPAMKRMIGRLEGFASEGLPISDPLSLFQGETPVPFVVTIDTGCTLTGNLNPQRHHTGIRAASNSEMGLDFKSSGPVTSMWVTS